MQYSWMMKGAGHFCESSFILLCTTTLLCFRGPYTCCLNTSAKEQKSCKRLNRYNLKNVHGKTFGFVLFFGIFIPAIHSLLSYSQFMFIRLFLKDKIVIRMLRYCFYLMFLKVWPDVTFFSQERKVVACLHPSFPLPCLL